MREPRGRAETERALAFGWTFPIAAGTIPAPMTLVTLLLYSAVHLVAWATLIRWLTPRWRLALAFAFPPLVALHLWERAETAPEMRERRQALVMALAWIGTLGLYVLWTSVT